MVTGLTRLYAHRPEMEPARQRLAGRGAEQFDADGLLGLAETELLAPLDQAVRREIEAVLDRYNWEGVVRPPVMPGTIGSDARALGGALLPLYANFAPDRDLFLKLGA